MDIEFLNHLLKVMPGYYAALNANDECEVNIFLKIGAWDCIDTGYLLCRDSQQNSEQSPQQWAVAKIVTTHHGYMEPPDVDVIQQTAFMPWKHVCKILIITMIKENIDNAYEQWEEARQLQQEIELEKDFLRSLSVENA